LVKSGAVPPFPGLGEVKILVPVPDWERAKELLSRSYDDGDLPWEN
jgi:hypothetical protein